MDLRETLKAAMAGDDGATTPDPVVETPEAPQPGPEASSEVDAPEPEAPQTDAQEHDEHGRFKPKTDNTQPDGATAQPTAEAKQSAQPATPEAPQEPIRVPPSLPAAVKAKFGSLDPDVRDAFVSLEQTVQSAKAEWSKKGERLNRFDEVLKPHLPRWQMTGLDEFSGVQTLLAAQTLLDQDPVNGLREIARSYGLSPAHIAQAFGLSQASAPQPVAEGQQAPTTYPDLSAALQQHLAPVMTQVQTLQQQLTQSQQQSEAAKLAQAQAEIDAFSNDPANLYFSNVSDAVLRLISVDRQNGGSMSLKDAYEAAIWADPTIRPLLIADQAKATAAEEARKADEARKATEKAARDKAQAAQRAGGSVTGSPTPGSSPPTVAQGTIRDQLRAAMQEHSAA